MHLAYPVVLSSLLFCLGVYGVLARRNAVLVLMSVELMLGAVNLDLVAFDVWLRDALHAGQALTLFTITIAAAEIGLGLAVVLMIHRRRGTADIDRLTATADRPDDPDSPNDPGDDPDGPGGLEGPDGRNGPDDPDPDGPDRADGPDGRPDAPDHAPSGDPEPAPPRRPDGDDARRHHEQGKAAA